MTSGRTCMTRWPMKIERMIKSFGRPLATTIYASAVTIITARLKDIRNANDTLELLRRPVRRSAAWDLIRAGPADCPAGQHCRCLVP
jgi:hypothetical protein